MTVRSKEDWLNLFDLGAMVDVEEPVGMARPHRGSAPYDRAVSIWATAARSHCSRRVDTT